VQLAESWLGDQELDSFEVILRFLEGQNLYMLDRRAAGLAHMRQAVNLEGSDHMLEGNDLLFFAEALFAYGGHAAEKEACQSVLSGVQRGGSVGQPLWESFVDCTIRRSDYKPVATIVSILHDPHLLVVAFDRIGRLLLGTVGHTYEKEWVAGLERLLSSPSLEEDKKRDYWNIIQQNRQLSLLLKRYSPTTLAGTRGAVDTK
jgi:hypothetical protein